MRKDKDPAIVYTNNRMQQNSSTSVPIGRNANTIPSSQTDINFLGKVILPILFVAIIILFVGIALIRKKFLG